MDMNVVRNVAARGWQPAKVMALSMLQGDLVAEFPLRDCLEEQGVTNMSGLEIGKNYYVETVTKYYCGELLAIDFSGLTLVKASWIPDTGRYSEVFVNGQFNEVEPLPKHRRLFIPAGVISAVVEWDHELPSVAK